MYFVFLLCNEVADCLLSVPALLYHATMLEAGWEQSTIDTTYTPGTSQEVPGVLKMVAAPSPLSRLCISKTEVWITLSDLPAGKPEYVHNYPGRRILFGF